MSEWHPRKYDLAEVVERIDAVSKRIPAILREEYPKRHWDLFEFFNPSWQEVLQLPNEARALVALYGTIIEGLLHHIHDDRLYLSVYRAKQRIPLDAIAYRGQTERIEQHRDAMRRHQKARADRAGKGKSPKGAANGVRPVRRRTAHR